MAPKGKMMKRFIEPNAAVVRAQLPKLRTKINIGQQSEAHIQLMNFIDKQEFKYGPQPTDPEDAHPRPEFIGKPMRFNCKPDTVPPELSLFTQYLIVDRRIPMEDISTIVITIYPEPKSISDFENVIDAPKMTVRDRFIYFAGSDDLVNYKMIDSSQIKDFFGMKMPPGSLEYIPEHVVRGNVYHFGSITSISLTVKFNNLNYFQISVKDGKGSRPKNIEKRVLARRVVMVDFLYTTPKFKEVMKSLVTQFDEEKEEKKGTVEGKMMEKAFEKLSTNPEIDGLIEISEETGLEADSKISGDDEDVEDIPLPGEPVREYTIEESTGYTDAELLDIAGDNF
jgi:hypothetical protein